MEQRGFAVIKCPLTLDLSNVRKGMWDNNRSADLITRIKQASMVLLVTLMFNWRKSGTRVEQYTVFISAAPLLSFHRQGIVFLLCPSKRALKHGGIMQFVLDKETSVTLAFFKAPDSPAVLFQITPTQEIHKCTFSLLWYIFSVSFLAKGGDLRRDN